MYTSNIIICLSTSLILRLCFLCTVMNTPLLHVYSFVLHCRSVYHISSHFFCSFGFRETSACLCSMFHVTNYIFRFRSDCHNLNRSELRGTWLEFLTFQHFSKWWELGCRFNFQPGRPQTLLLGLPYLSGWVPVLSHWELAFTFFHWIHWGMCWDVKSVQFLIGCQLCASTQRIYF